MPKEFGESVRVEALPGNVAPELSMKELNFALELARPGTTGGVAIILYHPDPSRTYESGYIAEESRCATLASIRDLVVCTTLGNLDSDAVTILDSVPFLVEDFNDKDEPHIMAHEKFVEILVAKQPSIVLSCFSLGTKSKPLELIRHWGVGIVADRSTYLPGRNLRFEKVNGNHPEYAINHHPHESRFLQLLTLTTICQGFWNVAIRLERTAFHARNSSGLCINSFQISRLQARRFIPAQENPVRRNARCSFSSIGQIGTFRSFGRPGSDSNS
jgi:hypothetical protein